MLVGVDVDKLREGVYVVIPEGRLDTDTHGFFREKIKPFLVPSTKVLIVNMRKIDYISSSGLGIIFQIRKAMEANGGTFMMTNLQPQVKKIFTVVKEWMGQCIFQSMEEADRYLDKIQKEEVEKYKTPPPKKEGP